MIQKVAEVLALKRQFGISGLVTREEMAYSVKDEELDGNTIESEVIIDHQETTAYEKITEEQRTALFTLANGKDEAVKRSNGKIRVHINKGN